MRNILPVLVWLVTAMIGLPAVVVVGTVRGIVDETVVQVTIDDVGTIPFRLRGIILPDEPALRARCARWLASCLPVDKPVMLWNQGDSFLSADGTHLEAVFYHRRRNEPVATFKPLMNIELTPELLGAGFAMMAVPLPDEDDESPWAQIRRGWHIDQADARFDRRGAWKQNMGLPTVQ